MLYTRNAFYFRKFYKEEVARENSHIDLNFVGSLHPDKKRRETGFSKLIYGNREDLGKLLGTIALNVAADDQAIYELIQNADDCKSSFFSVSYNEDYLLCINNGNYFSDQDMSAIINVAGNYKDGEDIGTFGIGFKILHRLVGADDGREAIINDYAGPIIFSWNKFFQLNAFLNDDEIKVGFDIEKDGENPWLIKLIYTCFPSHLDEKLRLKDYDTQDVKFSKNELSEMRAFLKQSLQNVNLKETNNLKSGSIFFLKLGKEKSKFLDAGLDKIKSGLSYSFKFLNSLQKIYISGEEIKAKSVAHYSHSFPIDSIEFNEINPKNKNRDIKFTFAFYRDYKKADDLRNELAPNLYTFFSMDEEKNGFSFLLHCNAFDMNNDRRKLQANSQINEKLLPLIAKNIIEYTDKQKEINRNLFLSLYANLLLSKEPKGKLHIDNSFFKFFQKYIKENIPTKNNDYSNNHQNVKINKLKLNLDLSDFGLSHIEWFEWDNDADRLLIDEATNSEKLGIESWDIRDIVENADLVSLNNWIANCNIQQYEAFLTELEESYLRKETKDKICQIELFKFSNGEYYSINDVIKKVRSPQSTQYRTIYNFNYNLSNAFFKMLKTEGIIDELDKIGIILSEISTSEYPNIFSSIERIPDEKQMYTFIADKCKTNTLSAKEKKKLFLNFINEATKFDNVADGTLKDLHLFCDSNSEIKPLNKLIGNIKTPSWLNVHKIKQDEHFPELNPYLISESEEIFKNIYQPNQADIISELTTAEEIKSLIKLYQENQKNFFKEFIIRKESNGFVIDEKTNGTYQVQSADKEARKFLDENCSDNLFVLPFEFVEKYKDEDGIIKADDLHSLILEFVDADEHKETLVDIVKYKAKHKFLQELSEFRFISGTQYTKENYEYKILDLACSELKEHDYQTFRNKLVIETNEQNYRLSEIPPFTDKIKIADKEFSLSKILPSTYQNSNLISDLITLFTKQGIPNEKLNALFGVNEELDVSDIFEKFSEQSEILENAEQFFFFIYYHKHIENIDLSKLGFDFDCAVFPSEFALENEKLPEYLQEWIKHEEIKFTHLERIGVFTENSTLVSLRKYFLKKSDFNANTIAQDEKLSDGKMLFNTFELLKEKEIELTKENEFSVFKEVVRVVNSSRAKGQELIIQEEFDLELLEEKSSEWKSIGDFSIYLFKGALPKVVKLDAIQDYVFYRYNDCDFSVNEKIIYINEDTDLKETLQIVASDKSNNFSFEDLWQLFGEHTDETEKLKQEVEILKNQLQRNPDATLGSEFSTDISKNDQKESNREAKQIVKEKLESEGFEFINGIADFSTINGVIKDGVEFPLVIKSYKYQDEPLKIGANEWIQLMRPNSMFWVHFGNRKLGCLKLYELLRTQDKLTISFSTENLDKEDRLEKFAELLHYFGNVHFDFNSVKPSDYSVAKDLSDYRFDERRNEEDLSGDDESIL